MQSTLNDNALCESFFASLECELLDRERFSNPAEAELAVFRYIEGWYNLRRRHSSLGYLSPAAYERANEATRGAELTAVATGQGNGALPALATGSAEPVLLPRGAGEALLTPALGEGSST